MSAFAPEIARPEVGYNVTLSDYFCGAGGSSSGAIIVPGVKVRIAANHWRLAVDTHNSNHPETDHDCADLSQVDPRRHPRTDIGWFSPECTNHSVAKGQKRNVDAQPDLFGDILPDEAADRSRATMWDVVRFAEYHRYRAIVVENVVDVVKWELWSPWLMSMRALGYEHRIVYLNSMHAQTLGLPAPQSRDRVYIVFWRVGERRPNFDSWLRPAALCSIHGEVRAVQSWKKPDKAWGRYRQQYVYRCPGHECRNEIVEPAYLPASTAIDWTIPGTRIGDRTSPLADKTLARIEAGLQKHWAPLLVPVEGRDGKQAQLVTVPMRNNNTSKRVDEPLDTIAANGNHHALLVPFYGTRAHATTSDAPFGTLTTVDRYAMVTRQNTARGNPGQMTTSANDVLRTLTTAGHQSVTTWEGTPLPKVEDCHFRMLEPHEVKMGMAFDRDYVMLGNKREQVKLAGNAVTPPAARDLIGMVVEALTGEDVRAQRGVLN